MLVGGVHGYVYSPPKHKACIASSLIVILLISPRQELFGSEDDIMEYVAWYSKNDGKFGLFPSFQRLDPIAADLVAGLLNPLTILRYGFQQVTNHPYGVVEF
ncbi:hypothetical protein EDD22DRAFT_948766 [Suillus occidentalis]|nr:hypothetical protein EDD22DRAFT_948766 [Suillus occidentalis]